MHKKIAMPIGIFVLGVWGMGIPLMIYLLMAKEKERLSTTAAKIRFGFLYNGYKRDNYFWEIVIMYRKIFCLIIAVFLKTAGIIIQALVLLIILVLFAGVNNSLRPFANRSLNEIEDLSLLIQVITIFCILFFISMETPSEDV